MNIWYFLALDHMGGQDVDNENDHKDEGLHVKGVCAHL